MGLKRHLRSLLQRLLQDVLDEGDEAPGSSRPHGAASDRLPQLLDDAQAHLDVLRVEWAEAAARQRRLALAWQTALEESARLDASVDAALAGGRDEEARMRLADAGRIRQQAAELGEFHRACAQMSDRIWSAIEEQAGELDATRRKYLLLTDRGQAVRVLEQLAHSVRELDRQLIGLETEFRERQAQIARREDQVDARLDLRDERLHQKGSSSNGSES